MLQEETYFELKLKINPQMSEIISGICFDKLDCEGVVTADEEYDGEEILLGTTEGTLMFYLKSVDNLAEILQEERKILLDSGFSEEQLGSWQFEISKVKNEDWSKKWKENWDVTPVGENIKVVPSWIDYEPKKDDVIITLDPGMAFGTGTHGTTQLCMIAEEKYMKRGAKVADIGTGSGILAVSAIKLGADYVYGCDNDESVIETAFQNAKMNCVDDRCFFEYKTADKVCEKFDFVVANILHFIIAEIMGDLKALMKDDAYLSLSGILDEKRDIVLEAIQKHGLKVVEENHIDIWVGFVVQKDI